MKHDDYIKPYNNITLQKVKWIEWWEPISFLKLHNNLS